VYHAINKKEESHEHGWIHPSSNLFHIKNGKKKRREEKVEMGSGNCFKITP